MESTPGIRLSKKDLKEIEKTPEETFLNDIHGTSYREWLPGKEFRVHDYKVFLTFDRRSLPADNSLEELARENLVYLGADKGKDISGNEIAVLMFRAGGVVLKYNLSKAQMTDSVLSTGLPMISDLSVTEAVKERLRGKRLWILTGLWYSREGVGKKGKKYVPVEIMDVVPGNSQFPVFVLFRDESGEEGGMYMNIDDRPSLSRRFHTLFSLTDPKLSYPDISPEVWELIQHGDVRTGMTKRECRLALGNPQDASQGHNQSYMMDMWQYSNGTSLYFEDGLLKEFRR